VTSATRAAPVDWYVLARRVLLAARAHWRMVALLGVVGGTAAGAATYLITPSYESEAAFQAEASQSAPLSGALAGLASQLGNLQGGAQSNAQFFADLLTTDAVLRRVIHARFPWGGGMTPLTTIYGLDSQPPAVRDAYAIGRLRAGVRANVNARTGVVRFTVSASTPQLAAALADSMLAALNATSIDLRRTRAAAERQFTSGRTDAARQELDSAERDLAAFNQRNRAITSSPRLQMEESRLRRAVDVAQQVYVQLRLQEEQAGLQEVRNTPSISVIDPPTVPVQRIRPRRKATVLLGTTIGLLMAGVWVLLKS
jgi:uncharacterized protein involved in exopolysaccharide biosynthesis